MIMFFFNLITWYMSLRHVKQKGQVENQNETPANIHPAAAPRGAMTASWGAALLTPGWVQTHKNYKKKCFVLTLVIKNKVDLKKVRNQWDLFESTFKKEFLICFGALCRQHWDAFSYLKSSNAIQKNENNLVFL